MSGYDILVFVHVLAATVWIGGLVMLGALSVVVLREQRDDPEGAGRLVRRFRVLGPAVLAPSMLLLLGFGVWLVADSPAWGFGQTWILVALGLFIAALVIGAAHQSRAAIAAERAAERGDHAAAAHHLRRWAYGTGAMVVLVVLALLDMVGKPGL